MAILVTPDGSALNEPLDAEDKASFLRVPFSTCSC